MGFKNSTKISLYFFLTIAIPQDSSSFTSSWVFLVLHFSSFLFSTFSFLYNFSGFPFPHSKRFFPSCHPALPNFFSTFSLTDFLSSFLHPHILYCSSLSFMPTNQKHQKCKKGTRHSQTIRANIMFPIFPLNLLLFSSFSSSARKSLSSLLL